MPAPSKVLRAAPPLTTTKGEQTRALILDHAVRHAAVHGFEALTIGNLAEQAGLSKSGLFAHFGSKEDLQIAALDEAVRRYNEAAFLPALAAPRGLPRLRKLFEHWLEWTERSGLASCPMMTAAAEFDRRDGPMRDAIEAHMRRLHIELVKCADMVKASGEFDASVDTQQFAFELFGIFMAYYRAHNLFRDPHAAPYAHAAFERLVRNAQTPPAPARRAASRTP
ncbi:MAG: TetR/AcrR family transcriptional regulator [Betaproteobacteria bacterium]|nr:TetR/AcrR family transcriptional regulator [Betaproteobacteria bacterium]